MRVQEVKDVAELLLDTALGDSLNSQGKYDMGIESLVQRGVGERSMNRVD
jgi:hypothetical protein